MKINKYTLIFILLVNISISNLHATQYKEYYLGGMKYVGEFVNGRPEGNVGLYEIENRRYTGEFKDGKLSGKGIYCFSDGSMYEGEFKDDNMHGKGICYYPSGGRYEGEYKDGKMSGKGIYYHSDGERYEGEFKYDKMNGKGIHYFSDGSRYEGEYKNGKWNGKGIYYYPDGERYEGEFKDNSWHGKGIFYFSDGRRLEGEFKDGNKICRGKLYSSDGSRYYEDNYKDDKNDEIVVKSSTIKNSSLKEDFDNIVDKLPPEVIATTIAVGLGLLIKEGLKATSGPSNPNLSYETEKNYEAIDLHNKQCEALEEACLAQCGPYYEGTNRDCYSHCWAAKSKCLE